MRQRCAFRLCAGLRRCKSLRYVSRQQCCLQDALMTTMSATFPYRTLRFVLGNSRRIRITQYVPGDSAGFRHDAQRYNGRTYPRIKYTNNGNGTWLVSCYNAGENRRIATPRLIVHINLAAAPAVCKPKMTGFMSFANFSDCPKGNDYDANTQSNYIKYAGF